MSDVFIVLGTGRCGTSFTAKIMHEQCRIFMGEFDNEYYEDKFFKQTNDALLDGNAVFDQWVYTINEIVKFNTSRYPAWGFKDPRATLLIPTILCFLDQNVNLIVCVRDKLYTVESMIKNTSWSKELSESIYDLRMKIIDDIQRKRNSIRLDYTEQRTEEEIKQKIKGLWHDSLYR